MLVNPSRSALQMAINLNGAVTFSGTCDLGTVGLLLTRDSVSITGLGIWGQSTLVYRGTGPAIVNTPGKPLRQWCRFSNFSIDIRGSQPGASAIELENMFRNYFDHLYLIAGNAQRDLIRLVGSVNVHTYYDYFSDLILNTGGIAIHLTGEGSVNRHVFRDVTVDGQGQALVSDPSMWSNDTNVFDNLTVEGMSGSPCIDLGGTNGARSRLFTFRGLVAETCPGGMRLGVATDGNVVEAVAPQGWVTDQGSGNQVSLRS